MAVVRKADNTALLVKEVLILIEEHPDLAIEATVEVRNSSIKADV